MKTPETNKTIYSDTRYDNVWKENPWNLPFDPDHVNRVRAISFPEQNSKQIDSEPYAPELAKIPQTFKEQEPEDSHSAARHFTDTSPVFHDEIDKQAPRRFNKIIPLSGTYDSFSDTTPPLHSAQDAQPVARKFNDTTPVVTPLVPTEKEFWREKETPLALRVAHKLGRTATRGARVTAAYGILSAALVPAAFQVATKAGEAFYKGADLAASKAGISSESSFRQHATKSIEITPGTISALQNEVKQIRKQADKIAGKPPVSTRNPALWSEGWWKDQHRKDVSEHLQRAQQAQDIGDREAVQRHLEAAERAKRAHDTPWTS